jgi:hypothetical protein
MNLLEGGDLALKEAIFEVLQRDDRAVICAARPWTPDASARITQLADDLRLPAEATAGGHERFLEKVAIGELLMANQRLGLQLSRRQFVELVIHYAEHETFPGWAQALAAGRQ